MRKSVFFTVLILIACLCLNLGVTGLANASAQTSVSFDTFKMENGAAVRIKSLINENGDTVESNGLRFSAEISQSEHSALKDAGAKFGMVIVAKDLLKSVDINAETVFGANPSFYFTNEGGGDTSKIAMLKIPAASENIDDDENIEICGSIVNIKINNFTRSFVGRAYVQIPLVDEVTGETTYVYHFAPYFENDINNNSRCIYYVAQRAIEEKDEGASAAEAKYITPFAETDRYKNYTYRYFVEHHYIVHDETVTSENHHKTAHIETTVHYGTLNSKVTAQPIIKPEGVESIKDINFVYDIDASVDSGTGLVYAGGMQTLKLYYESAGTISEEHKIDSLAALVADFLDVNKAGENFGLHVNGYNEDWKADAVYDPKNLETQIGVSLTAVANATKNRHLLLTKDFFDKLRAFGVESVSFDFHTSESSGKAMRFNAYQEEDESLPLYVHYEDKNGVMQRVNASKTEISAERITVYLSDITPGGGLLIEIDQSSSSNQGCYHFGNIGFTFPSTNTEDVV